MDGVRTTYAVTWVIENYSFCMYKNGKGLKSPEFTADGATFFLHLFPRWYEESSQGFVSLFLNRCEYDVGQEEVQLYFELAILKKGCEKFERYRDTFKKGFRYGKGKFLEIDEMLFRGKNNNLQNSLTVRCKIWMGEANGEGDNEYTKEMTARTRLGIKNISFLHVIESFSKIEPNEKTTIVIKSPSNKEIDLACSLSFYYDWKGEGKILVEITPYDVDEILTRCKLYFLDACGRPLPCGEADYRFDTERKDIQILPLSDTRHYILKYKNRYLPDDKLTLLCECSLSTVEGHIETIMHEVPKVTLHMINIWQNKTAESVVDLTDGSSVQADFKEIYKNQLFTDVELKTKTKSFQAHKLVLSARSPVFKAMLTNDMKERRTNCIEVDDLEDNTVQQFLLFLYSDDLENLDWESAIKLYYAADKYAVKKLKVKCASFFLENLSRYKEAGELLLLADRHNDSNLVKAVEDFILKRKKCFWLR